MRLTKKNFDEIEWAKIIRGVCSTVKNMNAEDRFCEREFKKISRKGNEIYRNRLKSMNAGQDDYGQVLMSYNSIVAMEWGKYIVEFAYYNDFKHRTKKPTKSTSCQIGVWAGSDDIIKVPYSLYEFLDDYAEIMAECEEILKFDVDIKAIVDELLDELGDDVELFNSALKNEIALITDDAEVRHAIYVKHRLEA